MGDEYAPISARRFDRPPWAGAARTHCIVFRNGYNKAKKEAESLYFFVGECTEMFRGYMCTEMYQFTEMYLQAL